MLQVQRLGTMCQRSNLWNIHRISSSLVKSMHSSSNSSYSPLHNQNLPFPLVFNRYLGVRYLRSRSGGDHKETDHHEKASSDQTSGDDDKSTEQENEKPKVDPALVRKLRMYVLAIGCISFVTSFILLAQVWKDGSGKMPDGISNDQLTSPGIDFQAFAVKYLNTGEVKEIVFFPNNTRAVAVLHDGAVVDGKRVKTVVVHYSQTAQQFWADVRKEESLMGISLSDGVKISLYQGASTFRVIEMLLGVLIIAWLGTQYGRLLRKAFLQRRAAAKGTSKGP